MSFTTHHNLELPDGGVQNWDASLNENFDLIENGPTLKATAGETIALNDIVYVNTSGQFQLALANDTVANQYIGFATAGMNFQADGYARISGHKNDPNWFFNAGARLYLSGVTPGGITSIQPSDLVMVGVALATNSIAIRPFGITSSVVGITGAITDHGQLDASSLGDDDHIHYLATDNRRSTSGLTVINDLQVQGEITGSLKGNKNLLINGDMSIAQRGTTFDSTTTPANSDDTYLLDRWILLSDGNDIVDVTQQSSGGVSGNEDYIRLDVETVSKKFGILQVIENKNCKSIIGSVASLSFEAKVTNATKLSDIRSVVISWDSTADTVTSDIISAWNVEGTRPTLVANWTEENTDADLSVTTSWVKYKIENISIDTASTTNVGVFIYQNDVATNDTAGIFLEITNVQLEQGPISTDFDYKEYNSIFDTCTDYYEEVNLLGQVSRHYGVGHDTSSTTAQVVVPYRRKRITPNSVTVSNASDFIVVRFDGSAQDVTAFTPNGSSVDNTLALLSTAGGLSVSVPTRLSDDTSGNSRIKVDAEL